MAFQIYPAFAVPMTQDIHPDAATLNPQIRQLLLSREAEGERYANPNPSLKQHPGVFESDFNLFSWPVPCGQRPICSDAPTSPGFLPASARPSDARG